jgi:hypothetical protein
LLGLAGSQVCASEEQYRREFLPLPTRAAPYPAATAVAGAQDLERLVAGILALEARINAQPVPENDRITERYRQEAATLSALVECDQLLIGQCDLLRSLVEQKDGSEILTAAAELEEGLGAIQGTLNKRAAILLNTIP